MTHFITTVSKEKSKTTVFINTTNLAMECFKKNPLSSLDSNFLFTSVTSRIYTLTFNIPRALVAFLSS